MDDLYNKIEAMRAMSIALAMEDCLRDEIFGLDYLGDWKDQYDHDEWGKHRKFFVPETDNAERGGESDTDEMQETSHNEL